MSIINNILVAPIGLAEAYSYIGVTPSDKYDVYSILLPQHINKWAKHKPIRFNKWAELTEAERYGCSEERMSGIYYGVKLSSGSGQIATLHNITFDYYGLREGVDIGRLTDLDGYDKNARPNPVGELPEVIHPDIDLPYGGCSVIYDLSNATGIDLSGAIYSMANTDQPTDSTENPIIGEFYPCVLVTINGRNFVRALWNLKYPLEGNYINGNATTKYRGFTKYRDNGVWNWQWAMLIDGLPDAEDGNEMLVTAFLTRAIVGTNPATFDWRNWVELTEGSIQINPGYAIPEAVAKTILLKNYYTKGIEIYGATWIRASGTRITIMPIWSWVEPKEGVTYKFMCDLYASSDSTQVIGQFVGNYPYPPPDGQLQDMMFTVDVGLLNPPSDSTFVMQWEIYSSEHPSTPCNSGQTTILPQ